MENNSSIILKEKIIKVLEDKNPEFIGIKFFKDYLNNTYDEKTSLNSKPKLYETFIRDIKNIPFLPQTEDAWNKILKTGDTRNAFLCTFDWSLSPEGYEFWYNVSIKYIEKYKEEINNGFKPNQKILDTTNENNFISSPPCKIITNSKEENEALTMKKNDYSHIEVVPTSETLQLMTFLSPIVRKHIVYPQIDVLNNLLEENKCLTEFYNNLKIKPKHLDYDKEFLGYLKGGDLRCIIYWAFNWATTKEGYQFWSNINAKVHSAITKELVSSFDTYHSEHQITDPITHVSKINNKDNDVQNKSMKKKHFSEGYGYSHYDCFFDDYDYYDEYYDSVYGYGNYGGIVYSTNKPSIPKDIINMQINNNYIKIEEKILATVAS